MRDYEDPVHVPPLALKIFTAGLIIIFIITPITVTVSTGYVGDVPALLWHGLAGVGFTLGIAFVSRLILWFVFAFYWYIAAVVAVTLLIYSLALIGKVAPVPEILTAVGVSPMANVATAGGLILGLFAFYLIFRRGGINQSRVEPPVPTTPPPAPTPQKQILKTAEQLAARKKDLGLDDDK